MSEINELCIFLLHRLQTVLSGPARVLLNCSRSEIGNLLLPIFCFDVLMKTRETVITSGMGASVAVRGFIDRAKKKIDTLT